MTPCIEWTGARFPYGYGQWPTREYGTRQAHRVVLIQHHVPIAGMVVRHRCDNPPCVNPDHLTVGSYADNVQDMIERGRIGNRRRGRRLTEEQVLAMRSMPGTTREIAVAFGVSQTTAQRVLARVTWTHL